MPLRIDRAHEQIGDEAYDQETSENVEDRPVDLVGRDALGLARVVHVVDDHRAEDAGRRPSRQQASVNGTDELRAEHVGEVGRDGREAAAVHRGDDAEAGDEQGEDLPICRKGSEHVHGGAEHEKDEVGLLTPEPVGRRRPTDAAEDVEQRDEPDEAGADAGGSGGECNVLLQIEVAERRIVDERAGERLLQHGRGGADNADTGRHVHA